MRSTEEMNLESLRSGAASRNGSTAGAQVAEYFREIIEQAPLAIHIFSADGVRCCEGDPDE